MMSCESHLNDAFLEVLGSVNIQQVAVTILLLAGLNQKMSGRQWVR